MYKSQFDKHLDDNLHFKAIFLYGQSDFFIEYYKDLIVSNIQKTPEVKVIYFEEYNFDICNSFLNQPSLFGGENILVIKTENAILQKELKSLIHLTNINSNAYLIVQYYASKSSSQNYQKEKKAIDSFTKSFSNQNHTCFIRFFKPSMKEALDILHQKARDININISPIGIKYLYQSQHEHLEFAFKELEKLALLDKDITNEDIEAISSNLSFDEAEDILTNILEKKPFLYDLQRLIEHKTKDIEFIRLFCDFLYTLILFNIFIKENGYFNSQAILGIRLPRDIEEKRAKLAIKYKLQKYTEILSFMLSLELELKTNIDIDHKMYLYSSIAKLQSKL